MKRNLWNELAQKVRQTHSAPAEMPFLFEERVLKKLEHSTSAPAWNPLALWMPLLRPAVGLSLVVTSICLFLSYNKAPAKPSTDFVAETVSMIQMAVLNE